jgi:hypothetical protein
MFACRFVLRMMSTPSGPAARLQEIEPNLHYNDSFQFEYHDSLHLNVAPSLNAYTDTPHILQEHSVRSPVSACFDSAGDNTHEVALSSNEHREIDAGDQPDPSTESPVIEGPCISSRNEVC